MIGLKDETPASVADWALATFGPAPNRASIAARANREMAELVQKLTDDDDSEEAAAEIVDVFIVLYRLVHELRFNLQAGINRKMGVNRNRRWVVSNGHGQHV